MRRLIAVLLLGSVVVSVGGCACRPGYIGPYGARPPRCWIW